MPTEISEPEPMFQIGNVELSYICDNRKSRSEILNVLMKLNNNIPEWSFTVLGQYHFERRETTFRIIIQSSCLNMTYTCDWTDGLQREIENMFVSSLVVEKYST